MGMAKKTTLLILSILLFVIGKAQQALDTISSSSPKTNTPSFLSNNIYTHVEQNPEFPGGDAALIKFLQANIHYPETERNHNVQGKVLLRFVVDEEGKVGNVTVKRSVSPGLDEEAIRVVSMLPNFKPGMVQGKPVSVYFNLPIVFKLEENEQKADTLSYRNKIDKDENFRNAIGQYQYQKWTDAIKYFKRSIHDFPEDYISYEFLSDCLLRIGKRKEACDNFSRAIKRGSPSAAESLKKYCN